MEDRPITSTPPANEFVGIDQTVTYAGQTLLKSSGITDTGTTLLLLATGGSFNWLFPPIVKC